MRSAHLPEMRKKVQGRSGEVGGGTMGALVFMSVEFWKEFSWENKRAPNAGGISRGSRVVDEWWGPGNIKDWGCGGKGDAQMLLGGKEGGREPE